ncbi:hypothetical protein AB833_27395 [Chromatiales bacterium (ex Bugula neritina AB1)]|nr:hypothetical protein AB833_27395 [Chromatiales bacterium (ex Bugula neritina AB1)]
MKKRQKKQQGLSLIELMIAITIGTFISLLVVQYMVTSSRLFKDQGADTNLEQNATFAISYLSQFIRQAGTREDYGTVVPLYSGACENFDPCTSDGAGMASVTAAETSDRIAVQMHPDNGLDCTGTPLPGGSLLANVFYIAANVDEPTINSLYCRGYDITEEEWLSAGVAVIDGVDQMQVLYGVADSSERIFSYVDAARVPNVDGSAVKGWNRVRAIKLAILVSDGYDSRTVDLDTRNYQLLDGPRLSITDRVSRRIYSTTIALNSKLL